MYVFVMCKEKQQILFLVIKQIKELKLFFFLNSTTWKGCKEKQEVTFLVIKQIKNVIIFEF